MAQIATANLQFVLSVVWVCSFMKYNSYMLHIYMLRLYICYITYGYIYLHILEGEFMTESLQVPSKCHFSHVAGYV